MNVSRQFVASVLALALLLSGAACKKKKPQLPPKAQAPTLTASMPEHIEESAPPSESLPSGQATTTTETAKPKPPAHKRPRKASQPPANSQGTTTGNTTVAVNRPAANPVTEAKADTAIAADIGSEQASHEKQTTTQLLDATEKNLKGLNRTLTHDEESMVLQIKSYIAQSRKATADKDFERAYNLATKAHLLSDALVKQ